MTNFNESKLSKILARRIIVPEKRANLLPFATPIYCPDNNGVKASKVSIIDPNANSFFTSDDFVSIGSQFTKQINNRLVATGTPTVTDGIYTGSTTNYYKINFINSDNEVRLISNTNVNEGDRLFSINNTFFTANASGKLEYIRIYSDEIGINYDIKIDTGHSQNFVDKTPSGDAIKLDGVEPIDLSKSTINNTPLFNINITKQPGTVKNIVDIELNKPLILKYFIPNEVDLKTNVDLLDVIKSDFAVEFKHAVSTEIHTQLEALVTGNLIPKITMGTTLADTFGSVIARIIKEGTGQKFSIYKYSNGAPIEYIKKNNQPNIDKVVQDKSEIDYASIDDIDVPALYYLEKPTLVLDSNKFEDYQQGLCSGSIKTYVKDIIDVDTTADSMTSIGEGIFGTNDCFAVAFTQPSIKREPSQDMFGDELYITIYYGVKLVSKANLGVIE